MTAAPLLGVRVLDLSRLVPGPFLTLVLHDLGADVIRVEHPKEGDYLRHAPPAIQVAPGLEVGARFAALNRGKRSLALDLKREEARRAFLRMVERAHVVVESFRPGVLARLGLGFDELCKCNPRIVLCSLSGYGQTGPWKERAGHDINYCATAGLLAIRPGKRPEPPTLQIADMGGALWGVIGILSALYAGKATHIDVSLTEAAMSLVLPLLGPVLNGEASSQDPLTGDWARYGVYATRDGHMSLGAIEPKFWREFLGATELAHVESMPEEYLPSEISQTLRKYTTAEWASTFSGRDVCCEPVLRPEEVAQHPLHQARENIFLEQGVWYARTPFGKPRAQRPPPMLGEHSKEVLTEYGFSDGEIAELGGKNAQDS